MSGTRRATCPTCRREVDWSAAARWRPFCSERCRLIDLGAWLDGKRSLPGEPVRETSDEAHRDEQHR